jgi:hypothetical protein
MMNVIGLLVILLSDPKDDKVVFGVVHEFKSQSDCVKFLRDADLPGKERLVCMAVVKPLET